MLASTVEKSPLKSYMQRKEDSRDLTLKICFAYLRTPGIWYGDQTGWKATSLSRTTLRTNGWSILPPEPWPTLNSESCWDTNMTKKTKQNRIEVILLKTTQDYRASDSQLWLPTRIIWGALKSKLHSRPIQHEGQRGGVGGHCVHAPGDANVQPGWKTTGLGQLAQ